MINLCGIFLKAQLLIVLNLAASTVSVLVTTPDLSPLAEWPLEGGIVEWYLGESKSLLTLDLAVWTRGHDRSIRTLKGT